MSRRHFARRFFEPRPPNPYILNCGGSTVPFVFRARNVEHERYTLCANASNGRVETNGRPSSLSFANRSRRNNVVTGVATYGGGRGWWCRRRRPDRTLNGDSCAPPLSPRDGFAPKRSFIAFVPSGTARARRINTLRRSKTESLN